MNCSSGFLDPIELSMISGNSGSSMGEKLPVIHEEGGESLSEFPNSQSDSGDVLALKEKLFKELPVNTTNESRTKHSSSPHLRDALTKCDRALVSSVSFCNKQIDFLFRLETINIINWGNPRNSDNESSFRCFFASLCTAKLYVPGQSKMGHLH